MRKRRIVAGGLPNEALTCWFREVAVERSGSCRNTKRSNRFKRVEMKLSILALNALIPAQLEYLQSSRYPIILKGDAALVVNETNDTPQRLDMSVAPDAKILRTRCGP
jgi:hypothetical protein